MAQRPTVSIYEVHGGLTRSGKNRSVDPGPGQESESHRNREPRKWETSPHRGALSSDISRYRGTGTTESAFKNGNQNYFGLLVGNIRN